MTWANVTEYGWKGAKIVWVKYKIVLMKYAYEIMKKVMEGNECIFRRVWEMKEGDSDGEY